MSSNYSERKRVLAGEEQVGTCSDDTPHAPEDATVISAYVQTSRAVSHLVSQTE